MRTVGRYRITSRLGSGGFAIVWLAEDPLLDARVAIKVLADNFSHDADTRARFIQEARLLRRLRSPHVVTVYDIGELDTGQPYFVMEYAVRGTLAARLQAMRRAGIRPSTDDVRAVIDALGDGLDALHEEGIVHRDVKPGNLLLRASGPLGEQPREVVLPDETIMLGDLGLAKVMGDGTLHLTIGGGTLGYAAPEQLAPNARVDQRADVFGASAVLAEIVTGQMPPIGQLPDLSDISGEMASVLTRGLSAEPADRYPAIAEWATDATAALVATQRAERDPGPPEQRPRTVAYVPEATEVVHGRPAAAPPRQQPGPPVRRDAPPTSRGLPPDWMPDGNRTPPRRSSGRLQGRAPSGTLRWRVLATVIAIAVVAVIARTVDLDIGGGPAIIGPDTLLVGQPGAFVADSSEEDATTWAIDPPDTPATRRGDDLVVTPDRPGDITVELQVDQPDGTADRGQRVVTAVENTSGLTIDGPARAVVGELTTYTARGVAEDLRWRTHGGGEVEGEELTIRGDDVGPFTLELSGVVAGERTTVSRTITVVTR